MLEIKFRDFMAEDRESFITSMAWDGKERMDSRKYKIVLSELLFHAKYASFDSIAADIYQDGEYIDSIYCFTDKFATRGEFRILVNRQYIRKGMLY